MAQTLTLARPARNLRPYLWLALPLLVLATLFFYPLLLIAEQALREQVEALQGEPALMQSVTNSPGRDLRVYVLFGQIVAGVMRTPAMVAAAIPRANEGSGRARFIGLRERCSEWTVIPPDPGSRAAPLASSPRMC